MRLEGWDATFLSVFPSAFSNTLNLAQSKRWSGFKVIYTGLSRKFVKPRILRIVQIICGQLGLMFWVLFLSSKYDTLYFYCPRFTDSILSMRLAYMLKKRVIVDQTELFSSEKDSFWHKKEEEWISKYSTVLLVISTRLFEHFKSKKQLNLYKFPIMVDFERFAMERDEIDYTMGYIGSFASKDNVELLLKAVVELVPHLPKLTLRLIGYNPAMELLEKEIERMGLGEYVEVTGTVAFNDIPWLLKECDTLLMNRDSSAFASYGYPIKLGEYFACTKPVVMSDGPGFSEDFEDGNQVYKYKANNVDDLVEVLRYRYKHIGESDAIAKRGYEYAKDHFASSKLVPFLANILNEKQ